MAEPDKASSNAPGGTVEDVKVVASSGPAGIVLTAIIIIGIIAIIVLAFVLLIH